MLLCEAPQVLSAERALDYVDLITRAGLAKDLIGKINLHYLLHEDGCPGEVGEECTCGLVVAFVGSSAMVMVDSHYAYRTDPIN
ncbi:hypothetical protein H3005_00290 [Stenotrophomonas sp. Br8]|uniref:hypothetical protein n=1 Tax=Stenotrophomonas sp. Br8 TaxID=2759658 RepID=UPI00168B4E09|nr:hypothetical protein [Stenotrophomonas sp. Br8]MBD3680296.1 hypothetical protein [Stenotrophomonas sp. Br8]